MEEPSATLKFQIAKLMIKESALFVLLHSLSQGYNASRINSLAILWANRIKLTIVLLMMPLLWSVLPVKLTFNWFKATAYQFLTPFAFNSTIQSAYSALKDMFSIQRAIASTQILFAKLMILKVFAWVASMDFISTTKNVWLCLKLSTLTVVSSTDPHVWNAPKDIDLIQKENASH